MEKKCIKKYLNETGGRRNFTFHQLRKSKGRRGSKYELLLGVNAVNLILRGKADSLNVEHELKQLSKS